MFFANKCRFLNANLMMNGIEFLTWILMHATKTCVGKNRAEKEKKYWIFVKVHLTAAKKQRREGEWWNGLKWCEVCVHSCDIWLLSSFSSSSLKTFLWNEIEHATKTSVFRKKTAVCNKKKLKFHFATLVLARVTHPLISRFEITKQHTTGII